MRLTDEQFATIKNYCKIDQDYDDDLLHIIIDGASDEIAKAIVENGTADTFLVSEDKYDSRFFVAVMKQVAEEYTQRGLTSTNYRFELLTGLSSIINQLRSEYMHETVDDDGENNILLDQFGDRSKNSPTDSRQGTR